MVLPKQVKQKVKI